MPARRHAGGGRAARAPARAGGLGLHGPAVLGALAARHGGWATSATWATCWSGAGATSAPTSCWSTRCTRRSPCRRWSPRRTCRPRAASPTPSTCGWRTCRSTPTCPRRRASGWTRWRRPSVRTTPTTPSTANSSWTAKRAALELLFAVPRSARAAGVVRRLPRAGGVRPGRLRHLVRAHASSTGRRGGRGRRELQDPHSAAVDAGARGAGGHRRAVRLAAVGAGRAARGRAAARASTPACGSAWCTTWPSACTPTAPTRGRCRTCSPSASRVGAPPDAFNQQGQDWSPAAVAAGRARRGALRAVPRHAAHDPAARRRHPHRPRHRPLPALVGAEGVAAGRGHLRLLRPRGADRHPRPGGAPGRVLRRGGGPRRRAAVGAQLPARARDLRDVDPVVGAPVGLTRPAPAAPGAVARAVPGHGHHARPAADRRLPRGRAHRASATSWGC